MGKCKDCLSGFSAFLGRRAVYWTLFVLFWTWTMFLMVYSGLQTVDSIKGTGAYADKTAKQTIMKGFCHTKIAAQPFVAKVNVKSGENQGTWTLDCSWGTNISAFRMLACGVAFILGCLIIAASRVEKLKLVKTFVRTFHSWSTPTFSSQPSTPPDPSATLLQSSVLLLGFCVWFFAVMVWDASRIDDASSKCGDLLKLAGQGEKDVSKSCSFQPYILMTLADTLAWMLALFAAASSFLSRKDEGPSFGRFKDDAEGKGGTDSASEYIPPAPAPVDNSAVDSMRGNGKAAEI